MHEIPRLPKTFASLRLCARILSAGKIGPRKATETQREECQKWNGQVCRSRRMKVILCGMWQAAPSFTPRKMELIPRQFGDRIPPPGRFGCIRKADGWCREGCAPRPGETDERRGVAPLRSNPPQPEYSPPRRQARKGDGRSPPPPEPVATRRLIPAHGANRGTAIPQPTPRANGTPHSWVSAPQKPPAPQIPLPVRRDFH